MRRLILAAMIGICFGTSSGCALPIYSGDPTRRAEQLVVTSENLRMVLDEWERIWFLDQPSHLTPYRTHGGIL